ncbi:hypothetical protein WJX74_008963 [Apatococcus lobatus]|uniref:SAP domain-containing protein n=1 Tax=Apatococcus lobatus TaxID=904363 RepID=A0AAW1QYN9_9CHLO
MASTEPVDLKKLKVQELRDELKKRDLDTSGVKSVLVARLEEAVQKDSPAAADESKPEPEQGGVADAPVAPVESAEESKEPEAAAATTAAVPIQESEAERARKRAERFGILDAGGSTRKMAAAPSGSHAPAANGKKAGAIAKAVEADPEEVSRRKDRAKRFGLPIPTSAAEEQDKRKARAARFDMPTVLSTAEEKAKLDKRRDRFGGTAAAPNATGNANAADPKLEARAKRFGSGSIDSADLDAKKKARAERFALP